jgi:hypothetical protein
LVLSLARTVIGDEGCVHVTVVEHVAFRLYVAVPRPGFFTLRVWL